MSGATDLDRVQHPFQMEHCADMTAFRRALRDADYSHSRLRHLAKGEDPLAIRDPIYLSKLTASPNSLNTLIRLFLLGERVTERAARQALRPPVAAQLARVGFIQWDEDGYRSIASLVPFQDLYVATDFLPNVTGRSLVAEYVMGVAPSSLCLTSLTPRRRCGEALDLGTGSGFQALCLAHHTARVIGTDISRRALAFAAFNARLNRISNIELKEGNLFEPLDERKFDLIVSNPPFMVAPSQKYIFRDSPLPGDSISECLIRGAAERLLEGGFAVVVFNWLHTNPRDIAERPREWVANSGCDVLLFHFETRDPVTYAVKSLHPTEGHAPVEYARQMDERLQFFERAGIKGINEGVIVLRRRQGSDNWIQLETVKPESSGSCSEQIERLFQAQDFLRGLSNNSELLDQRLLIVPDHRLEVSLETPGDGWHTRSAHLKQTKGFEFSTSVDQSVMSIVGGCDGKHGLRSLVEEAARKRSISFEDLAPDCLCAVRNLMAHGFFALGEGMR